MKITISIEDPTPEILSVLAPFLGDSETKQAPIKTLPAKAAATAKAAPVKAETTTEDPDEDLFGDGPADAPKAESAPTLDTLKALMREKIKAADANQPKIKALIEKHGAASITGVPKEKYAEFHKALKAI